MSKKDKILEAIGFSISALSNEKKLSVKMNLILEVLGKAIEADRAYIFKNFEKEDNSKSMRYLHEWCKTDVDPYLNQGLIDTLDWSDFPDLLSRLSEKVTINETVANSPNRIFRETMEQQGIVSYLFIPIFSGKLFWGYIGLDNTRKPALFSNPEIIGLASIAMALGNSIFVKKAKKKLEKARRNYLADLNSISTVIFNLDLDYQLIFLNKHWEELTGFKISEALGKRIENFTINNEDLNEKLNELRMNELETTLSKEVAVTRQNNLICTKLTISKVLNQHKTLVRFTGSLLDITKEVDSLELNTKLSLVLQVINETQINTLQNNISTNALIYLLKNLLSITGSTFGFIVGVNYDQLAPYFQTKAVCDVSWTEDNQKFYDENYLAQIEFEDPDSLFGRKLNSKEIIITNDSEEIQKSGDLPKGFPKIEKFISIPIIKEGKLLAVMVFANKPTDYSLSDVSILEVVLTAFSNMIQGFNVLEEKLKLEKQYRIISEHTDDLIAVYDADLKITFASPSIERKLGFTLRELMEGKETAEVSDSFKNQIKANNETFKTLIKVPVKDKANFIMIESIVQPVLDNLNNITGYVATGRDVTEREELLDLLKESLIKERENSQLKSRFISMASHEFRTPLATIMSSGEIISLMMKNDINENIKTKIATHLKRISNQTERLVKIISNILILETSFNSAGKVQLEKISFLSFLFDLIDEYFPDEKENNRIIIKVPNSEFSLETNSTLLAHIIKNLIENALKYSPDALKPVEVMVTLYEKEFVLKVRDYGIGIPETDQKHIFDSFYRGNNISNIKGTGLGLSIVKEFSIKLGVEITFESHENSGTTLSLKTQYEN
jgi:PAS domain S-box-containing protein